MSEDPYIASTAASAEAPYVGLSYYTEDRAEVFFGRDAERTTIIGNLRAARLTLLYAHSGVGKSSLLRAGVARRLRELAQRSVAERGAAQYIPVVFSSWRDEPVEELIEEMRIAIAPFAAKAAGLELPHERLDEAIEIAAWATGATLLVILDQFEEYFLYSSREAQAGRFADDLARCIARADLHANFLIAVREDAYAGLGDLFKGSVANVYGNYLQLEYLGRAAAREAIVKPIEHYNTVQAGDQPVSIEPELVEAVLDQVRTGEVVLAQAGQGAVAGRHGPDEDRERIETPYLQLVMTTLWERERSLGSHVLRHTTLEQLGGAQEIVRTNLDGALNALSDEERETAVDVFHHLVTPSGTKIVHRVPDLAAYSGRATDEVGALVEKLTSGGQRILRGVPAPPGEDGEPRVEIFHDVLAPAILAWRTSQAAVRLERDKQRAEAAARRDRRRATVFRALAGISLALLVVAIVAVILARRETSRAQSAQRTAISFQLARQALSDFQSGALGRGVLLSIEAYRQAQTSDARVSLVRAQEATQAMQGYLQYPAAVYGVAFSPTGRLFASAVADRTVVLQDQRTGRRLAVLRGHKAGVNALAFSPDGSTLATGSADRTVILWDVATRRPLRTLVGHTGAVQEVAFSVDGKYVASASADRTVMLWDPATGRRLRTLRGHAATVNGVAFSPDRRTIATGSDDRTAVLWDLATGRRIRTLRGHAGTVNGVAFAPDGMTLASASDDHTVIVWSVASGRALRVLRGHTSFVDAVTISPDGGTLASAGDDHQVILWDARTGQMLRKLHGHSAAVDSVAFSPAGNILVSGGLDDLAIAWDIRPRLLQRTLRGHTDAVVGVAFSPNGAMIASAGADDKLILWDASTGRRLHTLRGHTGGVNDAAFSPDGKLLVSAGIDRSVILWDTSTGAPLRTLRGHTSYVYAVAFSADGHTIASGGADNAVILWDARTGSRVRTLTGHTDFVDGLAFSRDGSTLASASADKSIVLWDVATGKRLRTLAGHTGTVQHVAISPDGRDLISASLDGTLILWDLKTARQLGDSFQGHSGGVVSVAYGPGGRTVASGGYDSTVLLWDVASRLAEPVATHGGTVGSIAFSPTGNLIASASDDHTVALSGPVPANVAARDIDQHLCRVVRRNLSQAEWRQFLPGQRYDATCPGWPR